VATTVSYSYETRHTVNYNGGYISIKPALPQKPRLYVIVNTATAYPFYIGTAVDVQDRFDVRVKSIRDMGFSATELGTILIYVVQVKVNGNPSPPDKHGVSSGIDVEHLLIRTYIANFKVNVRNASKVNQFTNTTSGTLSYDFTDLTGHISEFPISYSLGSKKSL
jgi:hypothetical protein